MTLGTLLHNQRECHRDRLAVIFNDRKWTYMEFDNIADRIGFALLRAGIKPGDRVALLFQNCPEFVFSYFGCFKIGAVAVPMNARLAESELVYVINDCEARFVIGEDTLLSKLYPYRSDLKSVEKFYIHGNQANFSDATPFHALLEYSDSTNHLQIIQDDALAVILYTSGTTAKPKGVMHSHHSLVETATTVAGVLQLPSDAPGEVFAIVVPLFHVGGFATMLLPALSVGAVALIVRQFEPVSVLDALVKHRVSCLFALPIMYNALVNVPEASKYDLSFLRFPVAGGDSVPIRLHDHFKKTFGIELCETCGMTEMAPYSVNPPNGIKKPGSIGLPSVGVMLRLVDSSKGDVPLGQVGEILVQSGAVMMGYWKDIEATKATVQGGWLHTGDLATVDVDGYYWFSGRKKDIIIRAGSNISPLEVEDAICRHPSVKEVGVVGRPAEPVGEIVCAFVVLKENAPRLTGAELTMFLGSLLASYKVPELVSFVPSLPRGLTGKVDRKRLRAMAVENFL